MRRPFAAVILAEIVIASLVAAPSTFAGGYAHGNGTGSCWFTPGAVSVGQPFTVSAAGLPTKGVEVELVVTSYEAVTHGYSIAVNPDGTWSGSFTEPTDGWWTFQFVSPSSNSSRLPNNDAACRIKVDGG
jgi:hypothetical protein